MSNECFNFNYSTSPLSSSSVSLSSTSIDAIKMDFFDNSTLPSLNKSRCDEFQNNKALNTQNLINVSDKKKIILNTTGTTITANKKKGRQNKVRQTRRIEANARERCRVHTISSAFETLRQTVPTYYNSYKLSKLGILRIACRYIESLNQLINDDLIEGSISNEFDNYVKELAKTIAQESKMKNLMISE